MARVAVVFTGGTISMRLDANGAAVPALRGEEILALTPGVAAIADLEPIDCGLIPASHLSLDRVLEIARILEERLGRRDVDGAVVVQGTDTIEETAFAWDLLLSREKPVVVTGAMRNADDPGYDGPANLRDAVAVAASLSFRNLGALVVLNGTILPADDARKMDTSALDAFDAPNVGPVGRVVSGEPTINRDSGQNRAARRRLASIPDHAAEPVPIVSAWIGSDGDLLRAAVTLRPRGLVVAATGSGNTHPDLLSAAQEAMARGIPVALASRAAKGAVSASYGFPGGGATWIAAGAMPTGWLGSSKARVALAIGLGAGLDRAALARLLAGT
jgi:L-asparaginase